MKPSDTFRYYLSYLSFVNKQQKSPRECAQDRAWTHSGMAVTFRAEVMPGKCSMERTVKVSELLRSGRVRLAGIAGEHGKAEFEASSYTTSTYVVTAREETFSFREMFSDLLPLISENPQSLHS